MDIFERNPLDDFNDVVFNDDATRRHVGRLLDPKLAGRTLFSGPSGTGKTTLCRIIAHSLVGAGCHSHVKVINVSELKSRSAICNEITEFCGFGVFNGLGKAVIILEELDGADANAQLALKVLLEDQSKRTLFLATTNNAHNLIEPIRDRFDEVELSRIENPSRWLPRAQQVLSNEGVPIEDSLCLQILEQHTAGLSGRKVMGELEKFIMACKAQEAQNANQ